MSFCEAQLFDNRVGPIKTFVNNMLWVNGRAGGGGSFFMLQ